MDNQIPFTAEHYRKVLCAFQRHPHHKNRQSVRILLDVMWQKFFRSMVKHLTPDEMSKLAERIINEFNAYEGDPSNTPVAYLTTIYKSVALDAQHTVETTQQSHEDKYHKLMLTGLKLPVTYIE